MIGALQLMTTVYFPETESQKNRNFGLEEKQNIFCLSTKGILCMYIIKLNQTERGEVYMLEELSADS